MAVISGSVWAIDIGNNSLKALQLIAKHGVVEVVGFENIQHGKVLTGAGVQPAERDELIALSLRKFASNHDLRGSDIVVSVPSQNSFARFVNLPPVEKKRIPEIVKFEAVQQIPFDIDDVQWDWQLMTEPDSPEAKVGIFAIKNEVVDTVLEHFNRENIQIGHVQMAPMALYNYLLYDRPELAKSDSQATVVLNIGADNTDLVVCTKSTVWQRCILIGGNMFTKAIAETFKLNFEKAEKLKRTAPMSKYARQIFQAMKPVFADLASEIQRSLGFYNSSNPNTKLVKIIALGGGTKMRGLLKYLQQTLQIPAERPDSFNRLSIGTGVSPAKFHENVCDFGIVYGLALQVLDLGRITSNLLPRRVIRSMAWAGKGKYFIAAACMLLLVSLMCLGRTSLDRISYSRNDNIRRNINRVIQDATSASSKLENEELKGIGSEEIIQKSFKYFKYRNVVPLLYQTIFSALPNEKHNPQQSQLFEAFAKADVQAVLEVPRKERKQIFITGISTYFANDIKTANFGGVADLGSRTRTTSTGDEDFEEEAETTGFGSSYSYSSRGGTSRTAEEEKKAGFVVTIVGYSPYKNLGELMDPPGVENDRSNWGFVTRLLHLDDIVDGNSPFELYNKAEIEHFKLEIREVDSESETPPGVGIMDYKYGKSYYGNNEQVLIDPMTKETISKVPVLRADGNAELDRNGKPIYEVNDHWFILNAKFVWRDAPAAPEPTGRVSR